jgi:hypothetical protein
MRRIDFSRRLEEASCRVRGELLNRGSQVRILSPAPGQKVRHPIARATRNLALARVVEPASRAQFAASREEGNVNPGLWFPGLGRRKVMIGGAVVLIVAIAAGLGLYLSSRAHSTQPSTARNVGPAPSVAPAGSTAVATPRQSVVLSVVMTSPANGTVGVAVDAPITIDFNLAVDPVSVKSFLGVAAAQGVAAGTVTPGSTPQEVVFKPAQNFSTAATVQVTVRSGLTSLDGSALDGDYTFNFATEQSPQAIGFLNGDEQVRLVNSPSGRPVTLTVQSGAQVPPSVVLKTYRASAQALLTAFVYANGSYLDRPLNTAAMTLVDNGGLAMTASGARTSIVQNNVQVTVSEPDGLYVVVAANAAGQYGSVWIDFSRFGVLLRQDDQRVIVAGEDLTTGATTDKFDITFYNLLSGVHARTTGSFTGTAEYPAKYPSGFDMAVAQAGGEIVVVPMGTPETNGDVRVMTDLSLQPKIFIATDRHAYHKGDTVRFAGAVRVSNDQVYALGSGVKVAVWSWVVNGNLAVVNVAADGTFSGSFVVPAAAFNTDGTDAALPLMASSPANTNGNLYLAASFSVVALGAHSPTSALTVTLDRASYVASDNIVASFSGVSSTGQPLAGQTVTVSVYASQHTVQPVEVDSFASPSSWGQAVVQDVKVKLDATGHAGYSFKANVAQKAADEEVTVAATYGTGASTAVGARTAVVYQAADEVFLLPARSVYRSGETVVAPFVVEARDGARVPGAPMAYVLSTTDYSGSRPITTVLASGTVTADGGGVGVVRAPVTRTTGVINLQVKGKDQAGNIFEDDGTVVVDLPQFVSSLDGTNPRLDMLTDKIAYAPGDTAQLTVTSQAAATVLLSTERGRVHQYRLVQLAKGDNQLSVPVTPDLAPGFSLVLSYFQGGEYTNQALPIRVRNTGHMLKVTLTPDQATYTKGQMAHVTLALTDAGGAAVAASVLADGYDARMSATRFVDQGSIAGAFLTPDRWTTNGSSSLLGVGTWGGMCGGGYFGGPPDPIYAGQSVLWTPNLAVDASGHASIDVPLAVGTVRLVVFAGTAASGWGQAEIDLKVQ